MIVVSCFYQPAILYNGYQDTAYPVAISRIHLIAIVNGMSAICSLAIFHRPTKDIRASFFEREILSSLGNILLHEYPQFLVGVVDYDCVIIDHKNSAFLSFRSHRIVKEILISQTYTFFKLYTIPPPQLRGLADIQQFPRGAIGTGGVPQDVSLKAYHLGHEFGEGLDGELLAGAGIDRFVTAVVVHQEHAEVGQVIDIEELAQG